VVVHESARKHGFADSDILEAATNYLIAYTINDDRPTRELRLGFDSAGRLLETVVLLLNDGTQLVIHAMKARPQYFDLLPWTHKEISMTNAKAPRHASGQTVNDELAASLADEAEAGYDPDTLRRKGGRPPIGSAAARVIPVRLDPELEAALRERVAVDHSNTSEVIRDALRAWLRSA